jgi:hypothetical protein
VRTHIHAFPPEGPHGGPRSPGIRYTSSLVAAALTVLTWGLPLTPALAASQAAATASDTESRLQQYETRLQALEARLSETREALSQANQSRIGQQNPLKVNGFLTVGASRATTDQEQGNYDWKYLTKIGDEWNWKSDSVAGVQFNYLIDEQWEATLQLLSRMEDEFRIGADGRINTEWAYLTWRPRDDLALRMGRMRTPLFMFSEYLDVGFAYPWVRPPAETYAVPFTYYDGMSAEHSLSGGGWKLVTQVSTGQSDPDVILGLRAEDMIQGAMTLTRGAVTFRTGYARTSIQSDSSTIDTVQAGINLLAPQLDDAYQFLGAHNLAEFVSAGMIYDDNRWLVITEGTRLYWEDSLVVDRWSHYLTVGRRFGEVMPYAGYAHEYTPAPNDRRRRDVAEAAEALAIANPALSQGMTQLRNQMLGYIESQKSLTLGLRWDMSERVASKLEFTRVFGFDENGNHAGRFDPIRDNSTVDRDVDFPGEGLSESQYITSLAVNAVF